MPDSVIGIACVLWPDCSRACGRNSVGTLTENRACGLMHFNLIHTTCIRYNIMYLYLFRELCLRIGMFLCVFIFFYVSIFI